MERNIKREAIVLKRLQIGESNIGITLLTETDEILFVMAFGAAKPKNKLFEGTTPFVIGKWDLYFDPVKEHWRAKDLFVLDYNQGLHNKLESFYTASLISEIALKTDGSEGSYHLVKESLNLLPTNKERLVLIQFFLRFLYNQGVLSDLTTCSKCERIVDGESLFFTGIDQNLCKNCFRGGKSIEINPGIRAYFSKTLTMDFQNSLNIGLSEKSLGFLKDYLIILIKELVGGKLLTLETCDGLI